MSEREQLRANVEQLLGELTARNYEGEIVAAAVTYIAGNGTVVTMVESSANSAAALVGGCELLKHQVLQILLGTSVNTLPDAPIRKPKKPMDPEK